jgi:hypothetical protein
MKHDGQVYGDDWAILARQTDDGVSLGEAGSDEPPDPDADTVEGDSSLAFVDCVCQVTNRAKYGRGHSDLMGPVEAKRDSPKVVHSRVPASLRFCNDAGNGLHVACPAEQDCSECPLAEEAKATIVAKIERENSTLDE